MADDEPPLLLRALRSLPPAVQAVLCPELAEEPEESTESEDAHWDGVGVDVDSARRQLSEAYLRSYAAVAAGRTCRHLAVVMDDTVRGGVSHRSQDLDAHADVCRSCAAARAELTVVQSASASALAAVLLDAASTAETTARAEGDPEGTPASGVTAPDEAASAAEADAPGRVRGLRALAMAPSSRAAAVGGVVVTALATAVVAISGLSGDTRNPPARTTAAPPARYALPTAAPAVTASATPSGPGGTASGRPSPSPTPSASAEAEATVTPAARTAPRAVTGFQLVNKATGLCVEVQSYAAGAALRLEDCDAGARQRWETVQAGNGARQLRNTGTHKCLDGTGRGGNIVRVVQNDCLDSRSAQQAVQLWTVEPEGDDGFFRLRFVPSVPASDYSSHLLGPEDWWRENPPRRGSYLAQLPNYYDSESFLFIMKSVAAASVAQP
ncbi:RICIN domain-containing protein [Streptomyces sp. Amel2xC10]|uniref:RICIN domain-containing protein n=1 Tax=Streptomyces sp. Amel2xC10 TaxID=1305826 RepID=UPI000A162999|nr:RICIN domain-containing protein [Streptomyces sp. Amel2xC10]